MKKILLIFSLSLILLLLYLSECQQPIISGTVEKVTYGNQVTFIKLANHSEEILIFSYLPLEVDKKIKIYGKKENKEIIAERIIKMQP